MNVLVVGASGGSGLACVRYLMAAGHCVTALVRRPEYRAALGERVRIAVGDALDSGFIDTAVTGQDAVVVTLGIRESALRVRFWGAKKTSTNVRSCGTRHVIAAMNRHGVRRLVVQSTYGVGPTHNQLPWRYRVIFALLLKPQIKDTEIQENATRHSGLNWTIVQPVSLTDEHLSAAPHVSLDGRTSAMRVSRNQIGMFIASDLERSEFTHQTVVLSDSHSR